MEQLSLGVAMSDLCWQRLILRDFVLLYKEACDAQVPDSLDLLVRWVHVLLKL